MNPGIYDNVSMEDYLADSAVSRSQLCLLGNRSPAHLKAQIDGEKKKVTKALKMGGIIDIAVFELETLEKRVHLRPETCLTAKGCKVPWDLKTNDAQAWVAAHQDKPIASLDEIKVACEIARSVRSHPACKRALEHGKAQQTVVCNAVELIAVDTDVTVKIRPDWLSGNAIVDLKSTVDGSREEFAKSIYNYGYDVQAALYIDVCNAMKARKEAFVFLCVEKEPPYAVSVYALDAESVEIGRRKYRYWLATYCECVRSGQWPGYADTIEVIGLTDWAKRNGV